MSSNETVADAQATAKTCFTPELAQARLIRAREMLTACEHREQRARDKVVEAGGPAHCPEWTIGTLVRAHEVTFAAAIDVSRWEQRLTEATS